MTVLTSALHRLYSAKLDPLELKVWNSYSKRLDKYNDLFDTLDKDAFNKKVFPEISNFLESEMVYLKNGRKLKRLDQVNRNIFWKIARDRTDPRWPRAYAFYNKFYNRQIPKDLLNGTGRKVIKDFKVGEYHVAVDDNDNLLVVKVVRIDPNNGGTVYVKAADTFDGLKSSPIYPCKVEKDKNNRERDYATAGGEVYETYRYLQKIVFKVDGREYEADYETYDVEDLEEDFPDFF